MSGMSEREREVRQRLRSDLPHYAAKALRIRKKDGGTAPLFLNRAQRHIHEKLEEQRKDSGKVRALILKGRQQGCSTYVGARFFHQVTHRFGTKCFILTHEQDATDNLFSMVDRYYANLPDLVKPHAALANAKELYFDKLDSGYGVATARTKATGRSQTLQLFHGSEVAFWPNPYDHAAGVLQAIPDAEGTEVILESTANGVGGYFHEKWQEAERGQGDYLAVFVPWYWQDEYRRPVGVGFQLDEEELEYKRAWGLDDEQMAWRRQKLAELKDPLLFKQEYPACAAEAFQLTGHDSFITADKVLAARKAEIEATGPLVMGVDPARFGDDATAIAYRRGRSVSRVERYYKQDTMETVGRVKQAIDRDKPARVFVDVGGLGAGVYDRLKEMGYGNVVRPVNFGAAPLEPGTSQGGGPRNRRAEMWIALKEWLDDPAGVSIPDEDMLQADICGPGYKYDSSSRVLLESKEDMRKREVQSPDAADALALTFAAPVNPASSVDHAKRQRQAVRSWMA